jgi:hypothetical protein
LAAPVVVHVSSTLVGALHDTEVVVAERLVTLAAEATGGRVVVVVVEFVVVEVVAMAVLVSGTVVTVVDGDGLELLLHALMRAATNTNRITSRGIWRSYVELRFPCGRSGAKDGAAREQ